MRGRSFSQLREMGSCWNRCQTNRKSKDRKEGKNRSCQDHAAAAALQGCIGMFYVKLEARLAWLVPASATEPASRKRRIDFASGAPSLATDH